MPKRLLLSEKADGNGDDNMPEIDFLQSLLKISGKMMDTACLLRYNRLQVHGRASFQTKWGIRFCGHTILCVCSLDI